MGRAVGHFLQYLAMATFHGSIAYSKVCRRSPAGILEADEPRDLSFSFLRNEVAKEQRKSLRLCSFPALRETGLISI